MAKETPATVEKAEAKPKFSIEKLRQNCYAVFGVSQSTFDGATYGIDGEFTVEEMKNAIEKWQNKEAK